ncbi:ABC transporter substrate-binding protein [Nocardioides sp. L-11A]|uniref:ABC transporter substrate-binding protein n=1 Tax=Nocardioides sp. L-11A TaxID=3043848 RepID=UPI00249B61EA|nr:ABC transporter substrate-binding protein [Nocardioides sp. L-11A]
MTRFTTARRSLVAAIALGSMLTVAACGTGEAGTASGSGGGSADDPLRVGLLFSLTGPAAPYGISERNGARVVLDDINADGGINGKKIEIFEADDKTDPTTAAQEARKLITQDKVDVIIGTTAGGNTLAYAPIAAGLKTPILATNGTISVTDKANDFWPWIFRSAPSDLVTMQAMLDQVVAEGKTKVGIFAEQSAYGDSSVAYIEEQADDLGLDLVGTTSAAVTDTDFTAQATKLRNADPDVVLLVTGATALGVGIARAVRQGGSDVDLWGGIGLAQQGFIDGAGEAAEGVHMVAMNNWNNPSEDEKRLKDLLEAAGYDATSYEAAGANGAQVVAAGAEKIDGEITGEKLRDAMENVCDLDTYAIGASVCYTKDERDGMGTDALALLVVEDGAFATYQPGS